MSGTNLFNGELDKVMKNEKVEGVIRIVEERAYSGLKEPKVLKKSREPP